MSDFAQTIRARRAELGLTLSAVADRAGCSKAYLSGIENGRFAYPPSAAVVRGIERALKLPAGTLQRLADWLETPASVKKRLAAHGLRIEGGELVGPRREASIGPEMRLHRVPLINRIAAGGPAEFTDLDYPVDIADDYVQVPLDPAAGLAAGGGAGMFAARVLGDSMLPDYREGEVVVFSSEREPADGADCFVRLLPDHESTFKRVFVEPGDRLRLEPLNPAFAVRVVERSQVSGLYPAVAVIRAIEPPRPAQ